MNRIICVLTFVTSCIFSYAQKDIQKLTQPIVEEGKMLYRSEMASWYGTDLFLEKFADKSKIGGYFSYTENDISKCIFFSRNKETKVIGTISFDSTYNTKSAKLDLKEREFTQNETDLFEIRQAALAIIQEDTFFRSYKNTNLNVIPLISAGERKVYILTGPEQSGVVIFGNDYLLKFNRRNKLIDKKRLHQNIIPIDYDKNNNEGEKVEATIHSHLPETGDFITATDICTLMLYEKFANWKTHTVVSENYISIWKCQTDKLFIMTKEALEKIQKAQEEDKKH